MSAETIEAGGETIAYVIRASARPERTTFVTPNEATMQAGFVVYPSGGEVPRHVHRPMERSLVGTAESIHVMEGLCEVDLYDSVRRHVTTVTLERGDIIILLAGGHGFRMLEDTVLFEIKQGPYTGLDEKERF
jgi:quercetin dioxygenase-like cupin family protein